MTNRLDAMVARVEIGDLVAAYADVVTRRAWGELDELFRPDCEVVIDTRRGDPIKVTGGAGVGGFVGPAIAVFDFFEFVPLNHRVWLDPDDPDTATGRLYLCELRQHAEEGRRSEAYGVYHDRYRRIDDRWWFADRRYHSLARTLPPDAGRDLQVFDFPDDPWG